MSIGQVAESRFGTDNDVNGAVSESRPTVDEYRDQKAKECGQRLEDIMRKLETPKEDGYPCLHEDLSIDERVSLLEYQVAELFRRVRPKPAVSVASSLDELFGPGGPFGAPPQS